MEHTLEQQNPAISLIAITKELTAILNDEMECLKSSRPSEIEKFQKRKNMLTASYHKELNDIKLNGGLVSAGRGETVRELKKESRLFQKTLEAHHRIIKAKKKLSEQLIQNIGDEVSNQSGMSQKYGPNARMNEKSLIQKTTTLAINKQI